MVGDAGGILAPDCAPCCAPYRGLVQGMETLRSGIFRAQQAKPVV